MGRAKFAFYISLIVLIGIPLSFLIYSFVVDQWGYFLFSLGPSLFAGLTGLIISLNAMKKEKRAS
ncbi:hypothetical protein ACLIA0_07650 [Bacillaceae bacterium W0354]